MGLAQLFRSVRGSVFGAPLIVAPDGVVAAFDARGQLQRSDRIAGELRIGSGANNRPASSSLYLGQTAYVQVGNAATQLNGSFNLVVEGNELVAPLLAFSAQPGSGGPRGLIFLGQAGGDIKLGASGGPGGQRIGYYGADPIEQREPTTAADWQALFIDSGFVGPSAVFPSGGGVPGISVSGPAMTIGDATRTQIFLESSGLGYVIVLFGGVNRFEANFSETRMGDNATNTRLFGAAHAFYGGTARARANISAAYAALPPLGSMNAAYSQVQANQLLAALRGVLDALGNASGVNLVQTV